MVNNTRELKHGRSSEHTAIQLQDTTPVLHNTVLKHRILIIHNTVVKRHNLTLMIHNTALKLNSRLLFDAMVNKVC